MSGGTLVVATGNPGKLREFRRLLGDLPFSLCSLAELSVALPEEGDDYEANAVVKARTAARAAGLPALADDSGLEVAALGGAPGPRSARYGGPDLDDAGRVARLLGELQGVPRDRRVARFVCVAALADPDGAVVTARGVCPGRILESPRGVGGFGYDPVFWVEERGAAMAELADADKDALSHRGRAVAQLRDALQSRANTSSGAG